MNPKAAVNEEVRKITLFGPQEVGKSTLRKLIFEGDGIMHLLEHPIEPTYGAEPFSYKLDYQYGIFDLSGQETERWFTVDSNIFKDSDIIVNVLDARSASKIVVDFIQRALTIEKEQASTAKIFFLIHKIDLLDAVQLDRLKEKINGSQLEFAQILQRPVPIFYTSIKSAYIFDTISAFVEILKHAGMDQSGDINTQLILLNTNLFHLLTLYKERSIKYLIECMDVAPAYLNGLIKLYENAGFLKTKLQENEVYVSLTEKGLNFYHQIIKNFERLSSQPDTGITTKDSYITSMNECESAITVSPENIPIIPPLSSDLPPHEVIYGILISDSNGKTLIIAEMSKNVLTNSLNRANNPQFDIELIPMFINALFKFSEEINMRNLQSFLVQGGNLKFSSISQGDLTFTLFSHPEFELEYVKTEFTSLFGDFIQKYADYLPLFAKTGNVTRFQEFLPELRSRVTDIITTYQNNLRNAPKFNLNYAKQVYSQLNTKQDGSLTKEQQTKIKNLKVKLLETILEEDMQHFHELEEQVKLFI